MASFLLLLFLFSSPSYAANVVDVLSKEEARKLAEMVQLPGLEKFISDQAKAALIHKVGNKLIEWTAEAVKKVPGTFGAPSPKEPGTLLQMRLQEWLPGEAKKVLQDSFLQEEAQAEILSELQKTLVAQTDDLLEGWEEEMKSRQIGLHLTNKIGDLIGQSAVQGLQKNILKGLKGELPEEALSFLRQGPDRFAEYIEKGRAYLPGAQFSKLKNKLLGIHIVDLPNQAYGGILAASAAMHLAKAFAGPKVNFYELKRAKEVTQTLVWQLKNKKYVSLTLGDFTEMIKKLGDQLGSFNWPPLKQIARWNPASLFLKELDEIEAKFKTINRYYDQVTGKILEGMNKPIAELEKKLKELSKKMLRPFHQPIECFGILEEGCPDLSPRVPDLGLGRAPGEKGVPPKPEREEKSPKKKRPQKIGPRAEILEQEKIPPKNVSDQADFEPVLLHNGEFYYTATDVTIPGPSTSSGGIDFQFTRIYRSRSEFLGVLGFHWTHNFAQRLAFWESPEGPGLTYIDGEGKKYFLREIEGGLYQPPAGLEVELVRTEEGYLLSREGLRYFFGSEGFLQSIEQEDGNRLTLFYDEKNQLEKIVDTFDHPIRFFYQADGLLEKLEDHTGRVWRFQYSEELNLIAAIAPGTPSFPKGKTTRYRYQDHKMTTIMDPKGQIYLENYYAEVGKDAGKILAQRYGEKDWITEARYDGLNTWVIDRRGVLRRYEHDRSGMLKNADPVSFVDVPNRPPTSFSARYDYEYDPWGNIVALKEPNGDERRFEVDANNLITKETVGGEERLYQYDANDNIATIDVPARGLRLEFEYDILDRLIAKKEILNGTKTITTRYEYDPQGRLIRFVYPLGNEIRFANDQKVSDTFWSKLPESIGHFPVEYDPIGRPTQINDSKLEWDDNSRLASLTDAKGQTTRYSYDILNRLVLEKFPDGTEKSYAYDSSDRLVGMTDRAGITHVWNYDQNGNLVSATSKNFKQEFFYDEKGHLTEAIDHNSLADLRDDVKVEFAYNEKGNITGEGIHGRWVYKNYNTAGFKTGILYPDKTQVVKKYDGQGKLIEIFAKQYSILHQKNYEEAQPEPSLLVPPPELKRDVQGNLIQDEKFGFSYDSFNRLVQVQSIDGKKLYSYHYDVLGRLARRIDHTANTQSDFVYDEWNRVATIHPDGRVESFIYGDGLDHPLAMISKTGGKEEIYYYHLDDHGSVRTLTDQKGEVVAQYDYDSFGRMTAQGASSIPNDLGYIGRPFEPATGLLNLRYRYYSPALRQFISADPLGYKNDFYAPSAVWTPRNFSYHQGQGGTSRAGFPNHVSYEGETHLLDIDLFSARRPAPPSIPETDLFVYAGNDPLHYYDPLGLYKLDIQVPHWGPTPNGNFRDFWGILMLRKEDGVLAAGPYKILTRSTDNEENKNRNPLYRKGDTPLGTYTVAPMISKKDRDRYGPHPVLPLLPMAGDALLAYHNGRRGLMIHGGREKISTPYGDNLMPTLGCIRMHNNDLGQLIQEIHRLREEGDLFGEAVIKEFSLDPIKIGDYL